MKKKTQEKRRQLKINYFLIIFLSTITISAQDFAVTPLSDFLSIYKQKHDDLTKQIEGDTNLSFAEKLGFYESEIGKLKETFKNNRITEYLSKNVKRAKRHSCKGERVRGVTDCASVFINAPSTNMYTKEEWVKVVTEDKEDIKVAIDSSHVRVSIKSVGMRENKAVVYATFKYKKESVPKIIENETDLLFKQIITN